MDEAVRMISLIRLALVYSFFGCLLLGSGKHAELDQYWAKVSEAVRTGDVEAYRATCHPDGVLVSGGQSESELLSQALLRWSKEFADTRAGKMEARVEFRFGDRILGKDTAHETGIFLYSSRRKGEEWKKAYVHFEALLVKRKGKWLILMEFQKSVASEKEWKALSGN